MQETLTGRTIGQYKLDAELGRGGMASVYKAFQASLKRNVAIKVMSPSLGGDPQFIERFQREATAIARLQHPNILPIYDFGEASGFAYIVMMMVEGPTLRSYLTAGAPREVAVRLISQVASALDYAHRHGVVHRDIKPANVLIQQGGGPDSGPWALLSDFGIAKIVEEGNQLTRAGSAIGTPEYMSPEQCQGTAVDGRSDIYSLGIMLYEAVTGKVPFKAETPLATAYMHISTPMPRPRRLVADLPEQLEAVIMRATAKRPQDRFPTAAAFGAAMTEAITPKPAPSGTGVVPGRSVSIPLPNNEAMSTALGNIQAGVAGTAADARTVVAGASEAIGDRFRDVTAVAGRAGHAVGDVAGQVVAADWAGAALFVIRRGFMSVVAAILLQIVISIVVVLTDARAQLAAKGAAWGNALDGGTVDATLGQGIPVSAELGLAALVISASLGLAAGWLVALADGGKGCLSGPFRLVGGVGLTFWLSIPIYALAALMLLPVMLVAGKPPDWVPADGGLTTHLGVIVLPVLCLSAGAGAYFAQAFREEILEWRALTWRSEWASRPALALRIIGVPLRSIGAVISLLIVVETLFGIPGVGYTLVDAAINKDLSVFFDGLIRLGVIVIMARLLSDVLLFFERAFSAGEKSGAAQGSGAGAAGWLALAGVFFVISLVVGLGRFFVGPEGTGNIWQQYLSSATRDLVIAAGGGFAAALVGSLFALGALAFGRIGKFGAWIGDLVMLPLETLAAVPWAAALLLESTGRDNRIGAITLAILLGLVLLPRGSRLISRLAGGSAGLSTFLATVPPAFFALVGAGLIGESTVGRLLASVDDTGGLRIGAVAATATGNDRAAGTFGALIVTTLVIAGWIAVAQALPPVLRLRKPLPWSASQE